MASKLEFSTVLGGNAIRASLAPPEDDKVREMVLAYARANRLNMQGMSPEQIMR